jgi:hypothetical protein
MASDATIIEVPQPPPGRLPFFLLLARMVRNPLASWGREFYDEPIVVYRSFGLDTVFVMDPELIQTVLLDEVESFSKNPLYENVLGAAGGEGLLIAEGDGKGGSPPPCSAPRTWPLTCRPSLPVVSTCCNAGARQKPARCRPSTPTSRP